MLKGRKTCFLSSVASTCENVSTQMLGWYNRFGQLTHFFGLLFLGKNDWFVRFMQTYLTERKAGDSQSNGRNTYSDHT